MRLLVTGGCGFIGSNFVHYILEKYPEDSVVNLDVLTYAGNLANVAKWENDKRYRFIQGDICDAKVVATAMAGVDVAVHFAAESHVDRSIVDPSAFVRTNVLGTQVLLDTARRVGVKRFHHVSTDEVFGALSPGDKAFDEMTPYAPHSPYSASKAGSDHLVRAYRRHIWTPDHDFQLFQQLWFVSLSGKAHSSGYYQCASWEKNSGVW